MNTFAFSWFSSGLSAKGSVAELFIDCCGSNGENNR